METFILITISGLGLGSLYFLMACGLSLVFGLMRVLTFAHGATLSAGGFAAWLIMDRTNTASTADLIAAVVAASLVGGVIAFATEILLIRPLRGKELEQLLATVGLGTALVALMTGIWGPDNHLVALPVWVTGTTEVLGAPIQNTRLLLVVAAIVVMGAVHLAMTRTRYGLIVRAGVENPEMVAALGINVKATFTAVFTVGGMLAGLGGALAACFFGTISPYTGDSVLIFAIIVIIIGGLGSIAGAFVSAIVLGLCQSLVNYYVVNGLGDIAVILLLVLTLLFRPQGLFGQKERLA